MRIVPLVGLLCLSSMPEGRPKASPTPISLKGESIMAVTVMNRDTDWLKEAHYGAFMHFLPGDAAGLGLVAKFDVEALAKQLADMGAKYFVLTLGQNSGYFNSPNAVYDRIT